MPLAECMKWFFINEKKLEVGSPKLEVKNDTNKI
jgi:hypothetical protein